MAYNWKCHLAESLYLDLQCMCRLDSWTNLVRFGWVHEKYHAAPFHKVQDRVNSRSRFIWPSPRAMHEQFHLSVSSLAATVLQQSVPKLVY